MQKHGYIGEFEEIDDHRAGKIVIHLNGESTSAVLSLHDTTSPSPTWKNGKTTCCHPDSSDMLSSPLPPVSLTTKKPGNDTSEVKFSDFSFKIMNMKNLEKFIEIFK